MVLMGGIVALLADKLGRKIGKKRLKLHHRIRPRHTATLFVVGSGLLIPLLTVFTVAALSSDVRTWLTEGEQAIQEVKSLSSQRESLNEQISDQKTTLTQVNKKLVVAQGVLAKRESELRISLQQYQDVKVRYGEARIKFGIAQNRYLTANRKLLENTKKLGVSEADLKQYETNFNELNRQMRDAYEDQRRLQNDIETNVKLIALQKSEIKKIENERVELESQIETLKRQYAADLATAEGERQRIQKELEDAEAELKRVREDIRFLMMSNDQTRQKPIIYGMGFEVARLVAPADSTTLQARNMLNSLLRTARIVAESRGAKGTVRDPAAAIFDQQIDGRNVTADEQMGLIVAKIAGVPEARILVATAFWNVYAGARVPLTITAFPNKLCFAKGTVIGEVRINGDSEAGEVIRQLSNWLANHIREVVLKAGMIPVAGQDGAIAAIAPEQVFEIVAQIRSASRTARVQAVAAEDIFASEPLKVEFRIR